MTSRIIALIKLIGFVLHEQLTTHALGPEFPVSDSELLNEGNEPRPIQSLQSAA